jgi:CO dehydrogenase/acetyl-CoA synthase alpha subunit
MAKEGNLEAPTRHPLDWQGADFYNEESCFNELERIFDICHGCRRCVSLCGSFPTLFDLVDESSTMEVDGVDKKRLLESSRSVLHVRPLLHDQVPLHAPP